ncbi:coatomer subunit alpha [Rhizoctonia solani AG-1 IA]|uniref:Coatomer subunit alpha n=1 Tax=Thanatephorus cucumeris (strain AG1-IA) TaxID=983506 RepID=L8WU49_THACA|nr:coatomer subunit alpha [Rhizoctonia solani AG-1 IA]
MGAFTYILSVPLQEPEATDAFITGPVRGVAIHPTRPLLVTGGDDYKVKVWVYNMRIGTVLNTLKISASDDQTIRIWNSTSRNCIAILTGHSHYIMSAQFHPKDDLVVSASMDQTVRVWDISGLRKTGGTPATHAAAQAAGSMGTTGFDAFDTFSTVKYVLEGHDRGVNYAAFHPTLPLIVSAADDRQIKLWRMSETKAWEVDTCRGHFNNVASALFHPRHELILSVGEDKTIRVWDMGKRTAVQTFRREHDRFWTLTAHPELNLFAAGMTVNWMRKFFKLERERPAFSLFQDTLYYIRDKYVHQYDLNTRADAGVLSVRKLGGQYVQPRTLSFNPAERAIIVTSTADNGIYELVGLPRDVGSGELRDSSTDGKRGTGNSVVFVARNRFAVLEKATQNIQIRDLSNTITKTIKAPVQTNEIFYGGTASLILSSTSTVVLYDIQQQKTLAELSTPPVKYVIWNADGSTVALLSKHTITIANKNMTQSSLIHETIRIKSGAWDDSGVFVYSTLNHIKYALPNGDNGIIKTLDQPVYLTRVKGKQIHYLDRSARPSTMDMDPTEYRFKLALVRNNYEEVLHIIRTSNLVGQSIISYLQKKGFPEIALHFVQDKNTRFDLAIECGNLDVALETAKTIDKKECWERLAQQGLKQGNHKMLTLSPKIVEIAYQKTKNFDKLSFLYMATGSTDKLAKMGKIAEARGDPMSKFQNTLYSGDVLGRVNLLQPLAYLTARNHGLEELAQEILESAGISEEDIDGLPPIASEPLGPPPVITPTTGLVWPVFSKENFFEKAMANGGLTDPSSSTAYVNGVDSAPALDEWEAGETAQEEEVADGEGWDLDEGVGVDEAEQVEDSTDTPAATAGVSETELWTRNSPFAADHVAAGSFETAMQLLQRQSGVVKFEPLKPTFMSIYRSARAYLSMTASVPPLRLHIRRNPDETSPAKFLPVVYRSVKALRAQEFNDGCKFLSANKLSEAANVFRQLIHALLLTVPTSPDDYKELRELISYSREYLLGASIELSRRELVQEDPSNVRRSLELAAYFTHCRIQPSHQQIALRNAMTVCLKAKNYASGAKFARRLLELNPPAPVVAKAREVIAQGDRSPLDTIEISYDEFTEFEICAISYTPIYKGSAAVKCPFTHASFLPEHKGKICPLTLVTEIGASASGLPTLRMNTVMFSFSYTSEQPQPPGGLES